MRQHRALFLLFGVLTTGATAQVSSSSSSDSPAQDSSSSRSRTGQPEAGGAAITLETSEPLFSLATALNACGYDADLADSHPVRAEVRADIAAAVATSLTAQKGRDTLCSYIQEHQLNDKARELAQYISLALYLSPTLMVTAEETDMPPDALQVVNILPLLRTFAQQVGLHGIWIKHRPEYESITSRVHDPMTQMILKTNIYLKVPVSSYDGRRLLILVEPMLAPNAPNARIYSTDYIIVTSPTVTGAIRTDQIRHLYLHYEIEPLVYANQQSMRRLTPLLKPVQDAPLEFVYKSDVVALVTECLIKAIEARTMDVGFTPPRKPTGTRARFDLARYDEELTAYDRQAEEVRRKQVNLDMRQGWVLVEYFYAQTQSLEHGSVSLRESIGPMVYGMDVDRERHYDEQIQFLPQGSSEFVRRAPRQPAGIMLAEKKMLEGDLQGALDLAHKAEADPKQDHAEARYVEARVQLMQGDAESSQATFKEVIRTSKNPHTLAWAHIYLGRFDDIREPADRQQALAEYKAALAIPGVEPEARHAAEMGVKAPFTIPRAVHTEEDPLDPSGKAEKDAYKPDQPH